MHTLNIKRAYEEPAPTDGQRLLVDRLWPRGTKKEALQLTRWAKELTPTTQLRQAYHQGDLPFGAFADAYRAELDQRPEALETAREIGKALKTEPVTLVYAARNVEQNHAQVLQAWLTDQMTKA